MAEPTIDPLVPKLRLVFGTVLPAATAVLALTLGLRGDDTAPGSMFSDIVSAYYQLQSANIGTDSLCVAAEDVEEERAKDRKPVDPVAPDAALESSPLLPPKSHGSHRSRKSLLYVAIGAYGLVFHSVLLIGGLPHGDHVAQEAFAVAIWVRTFNQSLE